jgi:hypothetical protein
MSMLTTKGGDYALQGNSKREGMAPHQLPREMVVVSGREGMKFFRSFSTLTLLAMSMKVSFKAFLKSL